MVLVWLLAALGWTPPKQVAVTSEDEVCPSLAQEGSGRLWALVRVDYQFFYSELNFYASDNFGESWFKVHTFDPPGEIGTPQLLLDPSYTPSLVYAVFPVLQGGVWRLGVLSFSAGDPEGTELLELKEEGVRELAGFTEGRALYIAYTKGDSLVLLKGIRGGPWQRLGSWAVDSPRSPALWVVDGVPVAACASGSKRVAFVNARFGTREEFDLPYPVRELSLAAGPDGSVFLVVSVQYPSDGDLYALYSPDWGESWRGFWFDVSSLDARWPAVLTDPRSPYFWLLYGVDSDKDGSFNLKFLLAERSEAGSRSSWGVDPETDSLALDDEGLGPVESPAPLSAALLMGEEGLLIGAVWNALPRKVDRDVLFVHSSSPPYVEVGEGSGRPRRPSGVFRPGAFVSLGLPGGISVKVFSAEGRLVWHGSVKHGGFRAPRRPGVYWWVCGEMCGKILIR